MVISRAISEISPRLCVCVCVCGRRTSLTVSTHHSSCLSRGQERKARLETYKLKPEDRRWAEQHGLSGDRGLFQGMIVRYRSSMTPPTSLPAVSFSTIRRKPR